MSISGGEAQKIAIARALYKNAPFIILDEPTEGIQPNIVRDIATTIRRLNEEMGLTVLLVEQKVPFARRMADTYMIMDPTKQGMILYLFLIPKSFEVIFLRF